MAACHAAALGRYNNRHHFSCVSNYYVIVVAASAAVFALVTLQQPYCQRRFLPDLW